MRRDRKELSDIKARVKARQINLKVLYKLYGNKKNTSKSKRNC